MKKLSQVLFATLSLLWMFQFTNAQDIKMNSKIESQKASLQSLIAKKKFMPEKGYTGVRGEANRLAFDSRINAMAGRLLAKLESNLSKKDVMEEFKKTYPPFELEDTEDRERVLTYFQEIMDILEIDSSDGLLSKLLYGFDAQQTPQERNAEAIKAMTANEKLLEARLNKLNSDEIKITLTQLYGEPREMIPNQFTWMLNPSPPPLDFMSLSKNNTGSLLIWSAQGRFMYSRQF